MTDLFDYASLKQAAIEGLYKGKRQRPTVPDRRQSPDCNWVAGAVEDTLTESTVKFAKKIQGVTSQGFYSKQYVFIIVLILDKQF